MSNRCAFGPTHSAFIVPIVCVAHNKDHPGIEQVISTFGNEVFARAVSEIRNIFDISSLIVPWGLDQNGNPYIIDDDQEKILDAVEQYYPLGAFSTIQTMVRERERSRNAEPILNMRPNCAFPEAPSEVPQQKRTVDLSRHPATRFTHCENEPVSETQDEPFVATSQRFRVADQNVCKSIVLEALNLRPPNFRDCPHCSVRLIGASQVQIGADKDCWCCSYGSKVHYPLWPKLPHRFSELKFINIARVINSLLSVAIIHGDNTGGLRYHHLSYHQPVMRVHGQLYARLLRNPANCWFVHDAEYDQRLLRLISTPAQYSCLTQFTQLLQVNHTFSQCPRVQVPTDSNQSVCINLDEDTRMCAVFVRDTRASLPPARHMTTLGGGETIDELDPRWELFAYPIMHYTGNARYAWSSTSHSISGSKMRLLDYTRSVILHQPGFWGFGRLAEQWVLDMWSRQEQVNVQSWMKPFIQDKLRETAERQGRVHVPGKIYLPNSVPGCHAYQRRFFQDALHLSAVRGPSHLFITFTCNAKWPEISALSPLCDQAAIARVFVRKRQELIACLHERNFLFEGHIGVDWIVYSTEWQKGDLPHAHIAVRLAIDTSICPMSTLSDQLRVMDSVVSARFPDPSALHYPNVVAHMQHPNPCKSCMQEDKKRPGTKKCRFYFPKPVCPQSRIDARGFPIYQRTEADIRVVPYNAKLLLKFGCHINTEWTFNSRHLGYIYGYMCKGVDVSGVKITEQLNEIASFRLARILTVAECVFRILLFNINYRFPAVAVCPIHLPRQASDIDNIFFGDVATSNEIDEFGDLENNAQVATEGGNNNFSIVNTLDHLQHYFEADRDEQMLFCDYFAEYYKELMTLIGIGRTYIWKKRQKRIEARMPWFPPYAGEIYYLRTLLTYMPARSFADLYGPFPTFKAHCIHLGVIETGEEYLYAMRDAITNNMTPSHCRHLLSLFVTCVDVLCVEKIWGDIDIRTFLASDLWPSEARGENFPMDVTTAEYLCLMDIAETTQKIGSRDFDTLFRSKNLPLPPTTETELQQFSMLPACTARWDTFRKFSDVVGFSHTTSNVIPRLQREVHRFRANVKILPEDQLLADEDTLNTDQKPIFDYIMERYHTRNQAASHKLIAINASAGCGKTYLMNRILNRVHFCGAITASVCSIGIGALQFENGRTVHSMFDIPINEESNVLEGVPLTSRLLTRFMEKGTNSRILFLQQLDVIIWDEIGAINKDVLHCIDILFQKIMANSQPFGGKMLIIVGDWRQIPPVIESDEARFWNEHDDSGFASIIHESVISSPLYINHFTKLKLEINERARHDPRFQHALSAIGNGHIGPRIPVEFYCRLGIQIFTSMEECCEWLFKTDITSPYDPVQCSQRALLSPYNRDVDHINEFCEAQFLKFYDTEVLNLLSVDTFINEEHRAIGNQRNQSETLSFTERVLRNEASHIASDLQAAADVNDDDDFGTFEPRNPGESVPFTADSYNIETLNKMDFKGVPPHNLRLYRGSILVLLRNIDVGNRLQNGVRLILQDFVKGRNGKPRLIAVTKAEDEISRGPNDPPPRRFLLHRIKFPCKMGARQDPVITRQQFPVRQCHAVSIHKSQSMTLRRSALDARTDVFEHGQHFVGMSRCRAASETALLIRPGQVDVLNIVIQGFVQDH